MTTSDTPAPKRARTDSATITDDTKWTDGDFEIIASDNVRFKVSKHTLFWASSVFKDASSLATGESKIELTDTDIETAKVVRLFLHLAKHLSLPGNFSSSDTSTHVNVLLFLRKWACDSLFDLFVPKLSIFMFGYNPLQRFQLGCRLNDMRICEEIFSSPYFSPSRKASDSWWNDPDNKYIYPFDPRGWSLQFYCEHEIPPIYLYALQKAFWTAQISGAKILDEFQTVLEAAKTTSVGKGASKP